MTIPYLILIVLFIVVSAVLVLIVLVQRPQGGGLAGAFGGAGGGSTDTVFGGRVGDALTAMTVFAFLGYVLLAIVLNIMDPSPSAVAATPPAATTQPSATQPMTVTPVPAPITNGATEGAAGDVPTTTDAPANPEGATSGEAPLMTLPVTPRATSPGAQP